MNPTTVTINQTALTIKEHQSQRVVTLKEIDTVHRRPEGTARRNFTTNRAHFIEGVDFFTITQPDEIRSLGLERPQGGTPDKVTLVTESGYLMLVKSFTDDLAWAVQRQLVNTYFRATDHHVTLEAMIADPNTTIKLLTALKNEQEHRKELEAQAEANAPKVVFADAVTASHTSILIGELAKLLKQNGVETGQNRLFDWLRNNGYLIRRQGVDYNMPTQRSMELGLFEIKETSIATPAGVRITKTPKVTGKGQQYFVDLFLGDKGVTQCPAHA